MSTTSILSNWGVQSVQSASVRNAENTSLGYQINPTKNEEAMARMQGIASSILMNGDVAKFLNEHAGDKDEVDIRFVILKDQIQVVDPDSGDTLASFLLPKIAENATDYAQVFYDEQIQACRVLDADLPEITHVSHSSNVPEGIVNNCADCFAISVYQAVSNVPALKKHFLLSQKKTELAPLKTPMKQGKGIRACFSSLNEGLAKGEQDASECMDVLTSNLDGNTSPLASEYQETKELVENGNGTGRSIKKEIGVAEPGAPPRAKESVYFHDIAFDGSDSLKFEEGWNKVFNEEGTKNDAGQYEESVRGKLPGEEDEKDLHVKRVLKKLKQAPKFIGIRAKRFSHEDGTHALKKINKDIKNVPLELTVDKDKVVDGKEDTTLKLQSFIVHSGDFGGGHYITYVFSDNKWSRCDDESVEHVSADEVKEASKQGYLFFYAADDLEEEGPAAPDPAALTTTSTALQPSASSETIRLQQQLQILEKDENKTLLLDNTPSGNDEKRTNLQTQAQLILREHLRDEELLDLTKQHYNTLTITQIGRWSTWKWESIKTAILQNSPEVLLYRDKFEEIKDRIRAKLSAEKAD